MKLLRFLSIILLTFSLQFSFAQTTEKWTLEKCINYALENNIQVRQAEITAQGSGIDHLQSKLNLLPTIDANASFSDNFGNGFNPQTYSFAEGNSQSLQIQLNGSMPIFTGLQQLYNIQRAKYDFMASKFDYETAKNNMALNVASSYLQVLLNKEVEKVAEKQRELSADQKDIILSRIKAGALPESAIYDIESQLGRDEVAVVNAKESVNLSVLALEQLLQLKDSKNFVVDAPEVGVDNLSDIASLNSETVYSYALSNQPVIKGADARIKSAEAARKISYGALSPTLAAFAGLSTGYFSQDQKVTKYLDLQIPLSQTDTFTVHQPSQYGKVPLNEEFSNNFRKVVGLQLDIPLFSKGQKILSIQKAKLQLQMRQLQSEGSKNQLRADIEQACSNARGAAESYLANKKSLEAAQKSYQSTESRYKAGMSTNFDIQQSKNNLIAAESQMIQAKYTYVFRMKILDFYQGKAITLN